MPQFVIKSQDGEYLTRFGLDEFGGEAFWSSEHNKAIKFESKEFAEAVADCHVLHPCILTVEPY